MAYSSIIDEFRQAAGRLALKHREEKAKRAKKPAPKSEEPKEAEEIGEEPAEEDAESPEEERAEEEMENDDDDGMVQVFSRATRHARVVSHPGHGQPRPPGPPEPRPTVRAAAEHAGMPPKRPALKPRVVGHKK